MKKLGALFLVAILIVMGITSSLSSLSAEEVDKVFANGEYELPFEIWKENEDKVSVADGYMEKPAKLFIEEGKYKIQATLKNSSWWQYFKVNNGQEFVDVTVISENKTDNTRLVQFEVNNIEEVVNAKVHIIVTGIPGFEYDNKYNIRFKFDTSNIPLAEEPTNPETPKPEEPDSELEKPSVIELENGNYTINVATLHAKENKPSGMARYIDESAFIYVKDGKTYVKLTLKDHQTVTGFQIDGQEPIQEEINEQRNSRIVTYALRELITPMKARVQYKAGVHTGDQPLRLSFNESSIKKVEKEKPTDSNVGPKEDANKDKNESNNDPEDKHKNKHKNKNKELNQNSSDRQKIDPKNLKNGEYSIAYRVLKQDTDQKSVMNDYVISPASLKVKDGKKRVAITFKNSSWITDFKVYHNGKLIKPKVLSHDPKADTRVIEFAVENLDKKLNAWVKVDIPEIGYHHEYDVQFHFDPSSIELLKGGETYPKIKVEDEIQLPIKKLNNNGQGPKFDRNADQGDKQELAAKKDVNKTNNPTTNDPAKIILFASLLFGSFIPIAFKLRKKFRSI